MYTKIITPSQSTIVLDLPKEMIGKKITVTVTEVDTITMDEIDERRAKLQSIYADCSVNLSNYTFDRNEANNYE